MNRTLRISSRPFIVFAIIFGSLTLLTLTDYIRGDFALNLLAPVFMFPCMYVALMGIICSTRVQVSNEGVIIVSWYFLRRYISFKDVDHSKVQILGEKDWPVSITIYGFHNKIPLATVGLKAMRKEDAEWLCSLPSLKPVVHPGLTRNTKKQIE